MAYRRLIARHEDGSETFIKSHDKNAFTDPIREVHSRLYLHKEHHVYDHLLKNGFVHIPDLVKLHDENTLVMQALSETEGWKWRAPGQDIEPYVRSVFDAIDALNRLPLPKDFKDAEVPVTRTLVQEGWDILSNESVGNIRNKNLRWQARIRPEFRTAADLLIDDISGIRKDFYSSPPVEQIHLCHHDMRQANIAWHPDHGTRLVDWSWTGAGSKNSDTTMLLIDLHKSGHDVSRYMQRFDTQHARSLMGFWLAHSLMPAYGGDSVRFHQFVSAISAYDLLTKYR